VNDAALLLKKPVAYGSIFRFDGQASTFIPYQGPCFRCLYAQATPPDMAPSCDEAGVLGVLPGVVGLIQATEVIKVLLNIGNTLNGRLLTYDALEMSFRQFKLRRDPECLGCGPNAHIDLRSIPEFVCAVQTAAK
jgi:adenylyltransferase/sulfurtransferase